ncbi:class I SAM-dependent methyltransferase [Cytophagaceae bacterium ABcell3]|nr:class I SAM-dependent methyltransferase [Cytophagaceae bacterium ABcell3]
MSVCCPLCLSNNVSKVQVTINVRAYYLCHTCALVFVGSGVLPSAEQEKGRYLQHRNSIEDSGYVDFLQSIIVPALPYLNAEMKGLDYGCGPAPVLAELLKGKGLSCDAYDPFFRDIPLDSKYDFIFSTEVFEHFFSPRRECEKIISLLKPGGVLLVMTSFFPGLTSFDQWHYRRDFTHVAFYQEKTFQYIADNFGMRIMYCDGRNKVILKKTG